MRLPPVALGVLPPLPANMSGVNITVESSYSAPTRVDGAKKVAMRAADDVEAADGPAEEPDPSGDEDGGEPRGVPPAEEVSTTVARLLAILGVAPAGFGVPPVAPPVVAPPVGPCRT